MLTSAVDSGGSTSVVGTLDTDVPDATLVLQFFSNASCDLSGNGEGERFEGEVSALTDGAGDATFTATLPGGLLGRALSATTVTSFGAGGKTSEFSACRPVVVPTLPLISFELGPSNAPVGRVITPPVIVWLRDDGGVGIAGATVTLSILSGPTGATLSGATATTGVDGRATFASLRLDRPGTYQLRAAAAGVTVDSAAFDVAALVPGFTQVSAGGYHTCGLKGDGTVACWGENDYGQSTPPAGTFTQVSAGYGHTCGVKSDGTVACWGTNDYGQSTPPAGTFTQVSAGGAAHLRSEDRRHRGLLGNEWLRPEHTTCRHLHPGERGFSSHLRSEERRHRGLLGIQRLRPEPRRPRAPSPR